ncbi:MAG TPA: hypothetical protein VI757_03280 [Bacteroidia bacterium]|nr:hypothetical protein [Bacteroidia bacterium]
MKEENYCVIDSGLKILRSEVPRQFVYDLELAGNVKEQVLRGRELNGESRDLDF